MTALTRQAHDATEWRDVPGYEGLYQVSDKGRVRSLGRHVQTSHGRRWWLPGRDLCLNLDEDGYPRTYLQKGARRNTVRVHRLVAMAFIGPPPFDSAVVCHTDGNPRNNAPENLRWATSSDNSMDAVRHGTHISAAKTHCPQGHPYDASNTYLQLNSDGSPKCRCCRACGREKQRRYKSRKKSR